MFVMRFVEKRVRRNMYTLLGVESGGVIQRMPIFPCLCSGMPAVCAARLHLRGRPVFPTDFSRPIYMRAATGTTSSYATTPGVMEPFATVLGVKVNPAVVAP
jgi:hypothetical protein